MLTESQTGLVEPWAMLALPIPLGADFLQRESPESALQNFPAWDGRIYPVVAPRFAAFPQQAGGRPSEPHRRSGLPLASAIGRRPIWANPTRPACPPAAGCAGTPSPYPDRQPNPNERRVQITNIAV